MPRGVGDLTYLARAAPTAATESSAHRAGAKLARPVELVCFALLVANIAWLVVSYLQGTWLGPPDGITDFDTTWVAGRLVLYGRAAMAYDWPALKAVVEHIVGHRFGGFLGWQYPPTYFFIAAPLALLPYLSAFIVWVVSTFAAYLISVRAIIGDRVGYFLGAAFPGVLANFIVGQNGMLSAGLIGGALILMDRQPLWAGALLGLLSYKPHLGLLFPIALAFGGRWRAFGSAVLVAALMAAASWAAFGSESWQSFFANISHALELDGFADWGKLQSAYGVTRAFGGSAALAWKVQTAIALVAAAAIAMLWRSRAAYEVKAAALSTGALLAAPHLLLYDLAILAVPLAFLFRLGREQGFRKHELGGIGLACLLILIFPFARAPTGFAAILVVAALVAHRALATYPPPAALASSCTAR
jgi:arabinofuranan 3-O-arabinosyltransferase